MTITLNIQNEQLFDRILWLLNHFKNDALEISKSGTKQNLNSIEVKNHDFISRVTKNPRRISTETKFLSRDEANVR